MFSLSCLDVFHVVFAFANTSVSKVTRCQKNFVVHDLFELFTIVHDHLVNKKLRYIDKSR